MKLLVFFAFITIFSAQALVLDWSGSYEIEISTLRSTDDFSIGTENVFHNLHLKPRVHAFDGVNVRSWFHLAAPPSSSDNLFRFSPQEGTVFGHSSSDELGLFIRDLYLDLSRDFAQFQIGWKPHHFGMGMYYNDSSEPLSPVYSLDASRGFASLKLYTKSFYIQPLFYLNYASLLSFLIQGGFESDNYGVEGVYKKGFEVVVPEVDHYMYSTDNSDYLGLYAYYKSEQLKIQLEFGAILDDSSVYGGALSIEHVAPWEWLNFQLNAGISTNDEGNSFYFDPTFSAGLSFAIEEYEKSLKSPEPEYLKEYTSYSFHSAFYVAPVLRFFPVQKLTLGVVFPVHVSIPEMQLLVYGTEVLCTYQWADNITWSSGLSAIFPEEENIWHIGVISQAAITF